MTDINNLSIITDLTITFCSVTELSSSCVLESAKWHRVEKDLLLHTGEETAWLHIAHADENLLATDDLVVMGIRVGVPPGNPEPHEVWESRPGGIWISRSNYTGIDCEAVTNIDILFGADAVDPRPQWSIIQEPLQLNASQTSQPAKLSVRHGRTTGQPNNPQPALRVGENGKFKIVQISDTHMVTGVGVCKDAIDAEGHFLPESEADPLTVKFIREILEVEKPDLVLLTGDQLHHDIPDSQSALFKVVAPLIERSIPYAAVFGNHDSEGTYSLSRTAQMAILEELPLSYSQAGPKQVEGVGNYYLQIFAPQPSNDTLLTLYLLDSHEQISSSVRDPDYDPIKQSQIDWFRETSQQLQKARDQSGNNRSPPSLVFLHIPFPEFGDDNLILKTGHRREPTEGPSVNSHFYDALAEEGVTAVSCGHDHVNDFCALLPKHAQSDSPKGSEVMPQYGPWLCYGGGSGFGGYCSYGKERYHRRTRVWELDSNTGTVRTWKRVQYGRDRVDELVLAENGAVTYPGDGKGKVKSDIPVQVVI